MVVVKYIFQFGFFPWNSVYEMALNKDKPFFLPRILGLEKTDNYIRYDLLQLLVLFFHRSLLMVSASTAMLTGARLLLVHLSDAEPHVFSFVYSVTACGTTRGPWRSTFLHR